MDSTTHSRIQATLLARIEDMSPQLRKVAKYIIDRPTDFGLDTIRNTADRAGVSANTLVRMAQYLGFESFDELRAPFRQALISSQESGPANEWLSGMAQRGPYGLRQAKIMRNEVGVFNRSMRLLTPEKAEAVVKALTNARTAYITATRSSYALAYYFHYVGRMALPGLQLVPRHMGSPIEDMVGINDQDVLLAITFAPYSSETIQALKFANKRGAKVILLSDSEVIAPNIKVDHLLQVATHSTHHFGCYVGAMAVLECLFGHLVAENPVAATERIRSYEVLREDSGAYWKSSVPRIKGAPPRR